MSNWVVYKHISPSGKVYIGITSDLKSRWSTNGRHYCTYDSIFKKAIEKYGWENIEHEVILEGISKSEAIYAEQYLIRWYKIHNTSYNITDGGEGVLGRKDSYETIEKKRKGNVGKKRTPEQIERISEAHHTEKVRGVSKENIKLAHATWKGQHHSEETKRKMSEKARGRDMSKAITASRKAPRNPFKKPVIQLDLDNNIINEFPSITAANTYLGKTSRSITNCLYGRAKTAFGYRWEYKIIGG